MSLPPVRNPAPASNNQRLRFGCPACGVRLVVDQSIAGTKGPCPSCGALIVAPPLGAASDPAQREAAPISARPRQLGAGSPADVSEPPSADPAAESVYKPSKKRSVSPSTVISDKHREKSNTLAFFKILCAVLVVLLIVAAVCLWLNSGR